MDNLNAHTPKTLYEAFNPDKAKSLWNKFEFIYTPKHDELVKSPTMPFYGIVMRRKSDPLLKWVQFT